MYKRTMAGKAGKCIVSAMLAFMVAAPLLTGGQVNNMRQVQAATTLNNPRKGSNGVVTWDCVYFGRYPQSDTTGVKSDAIKWRVLSVNGNDALLIADCNLDARQYHEKEEKVTWEQCTMRSWLNGYGYSSNISNEDYTKNNFIDRAFVASEQAAIMNTTVVNSDGGANTADKVFLLSFDEAVNDAYGFSSSLATIGSYGDDKDTLKEDSAKLRKNTAYVEAGGSFGVKGMNAAGKSDAWWLRSPGKRTYSTGTKVSLTNAMYVDPAGCLHREGYWVEFKYYAVCPAIHLDLSSSKLWSYAGTVGSDGSSTQGDKPPVIDVEVKDPNGGATYVDNQDKTVTYDKPADGDTTVKIPDKVIINGKVCTVTSISDNAFKNNKKIKNVIIGNNVKTIGKYAFSGCTNLQSVTIGSNVKTIGKGAFSGCSKLKTVNMGKNVTTIQDKAFYKCKKLSKITIPSKVSKIGKQAFYGCKSLKSITIKTQKLKTKNVGSKAFKGIYSKAKINVPSKKLSAYKKLLRAKGVGSKAKIRK